MSPLLCFIRSEEYKFLSGSVSAVRRLIVAEAHPHAQEVASPLAAMKDNSGQVFTVQPSNVLFVFFSTLFISLSV